MFSLENLGEDLHLIIFKHMDIDDALNLLAVYQTRQLQNIFLREFQRVFRTVHIKLVAEKRLIFINEKKINTLNLRCFLSIIYESVQNLNIENMTEALFKMLASFVFPQTLALSFQQQPPFFLEDVDIIKLKRLFPNLRSFKPHGHFSTMNFDVWPELEQLTLEYCHSIDLPSFTKVLEKLRLKTLELDIFPGITPVIDLYNLRYLENLSLNSTELFMFVRDNADLQHLKCLKKLILQDSGNLLYVEPFLDLLYETKSHQIVELEGAVMGAFYSILFKTDKRQQHKNLQKITIVDDRNAVADFAEFITLNFFPALQEINFYDCDLHHNQDLMLLLRATQLKYVHFEACKMDFNVIIDVKEAVRNRSTPLELNMLNNYGRTCYEPVPTLKVCGNSSLFRLIGTKSIYKKKWNQLIITFNPQLSS